MKHILGTIFLCFLGYISYTQTIKAFYPEESRIYEWSESEIIAILRTGNIMFCKYDNLFEKNDTSFSIKNMEIEIPNHQIFESAYLESSICYNKRHRNQKKLRCVYLIINDKFGNELELTEDELQTLPWISMYLDEKIRKTRVKECEEYIPLD